MNKLKILTVDDDPDILDVLLATLDSDYEIIQACNGKDAIEKAKKDSPDLLILDYNLPDICGPDICKILRKDPFFIHTPILILTGKGEIEDKITGLEAGIDDYMVKPFSPEELTARIKMLIKRSNLNLDANPLTRLPGNVSINKELSEKIKTQESFAV
ncbi:MAG: response regulator, partial [Candidatus Omnitrophica bacterium]|nr:response regulator [Candidatus Omnitrophota bacterium]